MFIPATTIQPLPIDTCDDQRASIGRETRDSADNSQCFRIGRRKDDHEAGVLPRRQGLFCGQFIFA